MPYNNLNRSKGMLQSSHAPHMQAASRSSVGLLNPAAGSFNPQAFTNRSTRDTFASSQPYNSPNEDTSTAVVPHEPQHEGKEQITVRASELHQLTDLFNEEILSLRKDIEMLKQGGWTVTVGAFQPPKQIDLSQVEATRQRLQNSCGLLGALKSHAHFFSPATAKTQIEGPPSPPLTPVRASAIGTSPNAPKAESVCQNQDQTSSTPTNGLLGSKHATNRAVSHVNPKPIEGQSDEPLTLPPAHPDTPLPSTEDPSFTHMSSAGNWQPLAIRNLRPLADDATHPIPKPAVMETFSWDFLRKFLLGKWWSPGFYYHPVSEGTSIIPSRTYYLLDTPSDPYVPREPGAHGAKLIAFFNPENPKDVDGDIAANAFDNVPVFVSGSAWACRHNFPDEAISGRDGYVYMGMYNQLRFSDKLDYDRLVEQVPNSIKMYWAEQLADITRPTWVTEALMKAFEPKPEYGGPLPGAGEDDVVRKEVGRHLRDLKEWEVEARKKVEKLTKEDVLKAFGDEDAADPPGLRLWWEYLQCVGWDRGFYDVLVREQDKWVAKEKKVDVDREGW
ncbi:hypothetical protein GTA08_BOTSDO03694 [Botryosphaeria dothidea]|uniref:DUF6697 domain-containing protein n=1 Tax=Botryosphaeria dothidea TaxID=55169 RepID=A0A8H4IXE7_9PEZI|nr:hypothetical protein GTA08_BOTSDO03694 [Botryosphaeria dothidea]